MQAPLRTHLLLPLLALTVPLAVLLGYATYRDATEARNQALNAQKPLSAIIAADVGRKIDHAHETLLHLASRPQVRSLHAAQCSAVLAELDALTPEFSNLILTDRQGQPVCSSAPASHNLVFGAGDTGWFQALSATQGFHIGQPHRNPATGHWVSVLSMPVLDPQGQPAGAVHLPMELQALDLGLWTKNLPEDSRYGIFDARGVLLWRNQDPEGAIGTQPDWEMARRISASKNGVFEGPGLEGTVRFYATTQIPQTGWVAYFGLPSAAITAQVRQRAIISVGVGMLAVLALGLLAMALARRIEQPVRSLAEAARAFSRGDRQAYAEPYGPTELADLARDFNTMVADRLHAETELQTQRQQLQAAKDRLDLAMQIARMGLWTWDLRTGMVQGDDTLAQIFGDPSPGTGRVPIEEWRSRTHPEDLLALDPPLIACLKGETEQFEVAQRIRHRDGHWIWGLWRGRVTERDAQGKCVALMGSFHDITERREAHERLQLAASVFTHAREGITITDTRGTIIDVNDTFTRITGYSREEAIGNNPRMLQSGRQGPEFYAAMWKSLAEQGHFTGEVWNRRKNGELFAEIITISAVRNPLGATTHYVALFTDITSIKENERKLERIAHYDALTGLPNRVLLSDRLQQAMARCQRKGHSLAVAFIDLDGFKAVNDLHGHEQGDDLLVALAQRLQSSLREGDTLSRMGGDEFVAVLSDLEHLHDCHPVLDRMLRAAADPVRLGDRLFQLSASIGVTLFPADGVGPDLLIRHADQAMYQAKQAGKNRYHLFDVEHDTAVKTQREEIARLQHALAAQEFVLHYQPKVNMRTGQVIGAEALIRWNHPQRGLLPPAAFLPTMHDHAISLEVGDWVIATALQQMATWKSQGLDLPVSVNIDAQHLQKEGFSHRLATLLAAQPQVPASHLELEILETSALEDMAQVSAIMHRCQAMGVRFALDDFGTGYSSLTYLKRLGAEVIKIDQSFVRDMQTDPDDLAIVQGVIGLARAFHREVIAEGVETIAHGSVLLPLGCECAQGYGIARPMPAGELPQWVQHWRPDRAWTTAAAATPG
jgi:diguanylate cyclase (GGDEF)-like protein/PAS domain S-box-containing protein